MSNLKVDKLTSVDGTVSVDVNDLQTKSDPSQCKAWVVFDTTGGTVTILDKFNIASVTRVANNNIEVRFTNSFNSKNYAISGSFYNGIPNAWLLESLVTRYKEADGINVAGSVWGGSSTGSSSYADGLFTITFFGN